MTSAWDVHLEAISAMSILQNAKCKGIDWHEKWLRCIVVGVSERGTISYYRKEEALFNARANIN